MKSERSCNAKHCSAHLSGGENKNSAVTKEPDLSSQGCRRMNCLTSEGIYYGKLALWRLEYEELRLWCAWSPTLYEINQQNTAFVMGLFLKRWLWTFPIESVVLKKNVPHAEMLLVRKAGTFEKRLDCTVRTIVPQGKRGCIEFYWAHTLVLANSVLESSVKSRSDALFYRKRLKKIIYLYIYIKNVFCVVSASCTTNRNL